jgi:uncharacterized protein (TIGR03435 family)
MRAFVPLLLIGIAPLHAVAQAPRSFEVATIKPVVKCTTSTAVELTESGRLSIRCQPLASFIRLAYFPRIQEGSVTGGPKWAQTDLYDLVAKVDEADMAGWAAMSYRERLKAVQPQLQQLLAARFKLQTHQDAHATEAYALVQAKGGAKLKEVPAPPQHQDADEEDQKSTTPPPGSFRIVNDRLIARAVQIPNLVWLFAARSGYEDAPAVDKTGLDGYYDFEMKLPEFTDKAEFERQMNDQLGLRIEEHKVPLPTIVIDQAERPSLDN